MSKERSILHVGIDVGSTTTKIAALDARTRRVVYSDYQRHHADQVKSVSDALWKLYGRFPDAQFHLALTGSGAKRLGDALDVPYVQEVVANSIALRSKYEDVGTPCAPSMRMWAPPSSWAARTPRSSSSGRTPTPASWKWRTCA